MRPYFIILIILLSSCGKENTDKPMKANKQAIVQETYSRTINIDASKEDYHKFFTYKVSDNEELILFDVIVSEGDFFIFSHGELKSIGKKSLNSLDDNRQWIGKSARINFDNLNKFQAHFYRSNMLAPQLAYDRVFVETTDDYYLYDLKYSIDVQCPRAIEYNPSDGCVDDLYQLNVTIYHRDKKMETK